MIPRNHKWLVVANQHELDLTRKFIPDEKEAWDSTSFRDVEVGDRVVFLQIPGLGGDITQRGLVGTGRVVKKGKPFYTSTGITRCRITTVYGHRLRPFINLTAQTTRKAKTIFGRIEHSKLRVLALGEPGETHTFVPISELDLNLLNRGLAKLEKLSELGGSRGRSFQRQLPLGEEEEELSSLPLPVRSDIIATVKRRFWQERVRKQASENYPDGCAMCEPRIAQEELLIASHIKRWSESSKKEKYDPSNVLRLCSLHDELFERGFLVVDGDRIILKSEKLIDPGTERFITQFTRLSLDGWKHTPPASTYLEWHRQFHKSNAPFSPLRR